MTVQNGVDRQTERLVQINVLAGSSLMQGRLLMWLSAIFSDLLCSCTICSILVSFPEARRKCQNYYYALFPYTVDFITP